MATILTEDLKAILDQLPPPEPGEECYGCHRPVPKKANDDRPGPSRRSVVSISEPAGMEGTLDQLMIAVVDKHKDQFPMEFAKMRRNIGLEAVGGKAWKFHVVHFALYATLMVEGLAPETGEEHMQNGAA